MSYIFYNMSSHPVHFINMFKLQYLTNEPRLKVVFINGEWILEPDENFNRYSLVINSSSNTLLKLISQDLNQYFDLSLIETTNHGWIYKNFGLEAALRNIYDELNEQMNLMDGSIGEYDMRYIRTITICSAIIACHRE